MLKKTRVLSFRALGGQDPLPPEYRISHHPTGNVLHPKVPDSVEAAGSHEPQCETCQVNDKLNPLEGGGGAERSTTSSYRFFECDI